MSTVIKIEHLHKEYRLGVIGHGTLYRDMQSWWAKMRGRDDPNSIIGHTGNKAGDSILALKDVNLEIGKGEVLGIIGGNGAGKSTLLKILAQITSPTKGSVKIKGRIAALLEVGTGFHPELTGRENIYLNGAINGMGKQEVTEKLDEIVDFSGVGKFLDTPIKRYSSGMAVRLGFAVAAHLDPDIMLVDEVLAVGDASFQKKAIGKMQEVGKTEGRTVLFVSHNMTSIKNLCKRTILIENGRIIGDGKPEKIIEQYLSSDSKLATGVLEFNNDTNTAQNDIASLKSIKILQEGYEGPTPHVSNSKEIRIKITYNNKKDGTRLGLGIWLDTGAGVEVLSSTNASYVSLNKDEWHMKPHPQGLFETTCSIPGNLLNEGVYSATILLRKYPGKIHDHLAREVIAFEVLDSGEMRKGGFYGGWRGVVRPKLDWVTKVID